MRYGDRLETDTIHTPSQIEKDDTPAAISIFAAAGGLARVLSTAEEPRTR